MVRANTSWGDRCPCNAASLVMVKWNPNPNNRQTPVKILPSHNHLSGFFSHFACESKLKFLNPFISDRYQITNEVHNGPHTSFWTDS